MPEGRIAGQGTALNADEGASNRILPRHIAVIMDGNGRWARRRGLPRHVGHRSGVKAVRTLVRSCGERGVEHLTLFAFSSENWSRPRTEVSRLMRLFIEVLEREVDELDENDVALTFVGERERLGRPLRERMDAAEARTRDNGGLRLIIAVAYGGRWDIVDSARRLAGRAARGEIDPGAIDENAFCGELALAGFPDPDLLIRTGGERRISNFLLWNLAYTELYFTDCLWPDFGVADLEAALEFFARRQRRFGRVVDQVEAAGR